MDTTEKNILIAQFMGWKVDNSFPDKGKVWRSEAGNTELDSTLKFHTDWNWLMLVVHKINVAFGRGVQFAIFKTYVSCTVEKGGKFYKDFAFSHAEYITPEQTDIEATWKLVVHFIEHYNEKINDKNFEVTE